MLFFSEEELLNNIKRLIKQKYIDTDDDIIGILKKSLNYIDKLQKKNEQSQEILSRIKIIYQVHTKDCELTLKDIKKWEKILDK